MRGVGWVGFGWVGLGWVGFGWVDDGQWTGRFGPVTLSRFWVGWFWYWFGAGSVSDYESVYESTA